MAQIQFITSATLPPRHLSVRHASLNIDDQSSGGRPRRGLIPDAASSRVWRGFGGDAGGGLGIEAPTSLSPRDIFPRSQSPVPNPIKKRKRRWSGSILPRIQHSFSPPHRKGPFSSLRSFYSNCLLVQLTHDPIPSQILQPYWDSLYMYMYIVFSSLHSHCSLLILLLLP